MRRSHGSDSRRDCAGAPSLPPYCVCVLSAVRRYESYWRGKFVPHGEGSVVSSPTRTSFRYGSFASCLRVWMLSSSAATPAATSAATTRPAANAANARREGSSAMGLLRLAGRAVPDVPVTAHAAHVFARAAHGVHLLHQVTVAVQAAL